VVPSADEDSLEQVQGLVLALNEINDEHVQAAR
jgi:hypothetical protein